MTMFLIQSLLWLLAAFLLGYGIGRWLKGMFCKRRVVDHRTQVETDSAHLRVPVTTTAVAAGTSATAALARSREPVKPAMTRPEPELKTPVVTVQTPELKANVSPLKADLDLPQADLKTPEVNVTVPQVEVNKPTIAVPPVDMSLPKAEIEVKAPTLDLPKAEIETPNIDLDLPKVDVDAPKLDLPKVDVHVPPVDVNAPKLDLDLPQVDVSTPKLDLDLPQVDVTPPSFEAKLPEIETSKLEVKDIAAGVVGLGAAALSVAAVKVQAPDGEVDLTVTELNKVPEADVDLKTLHLEMPESKAELSAVEWQDAKASVDAVTVNVPQVELDLPDANRNLPRMDIGLAAANIHTPEAKADLTALSAAVPDTAVHLPEAGIELQHAEVGAGVVELNTPEGLYTLEGASVRSLEQPELAAAVRLTKPDGDIELASLARDASGQVSLAAVDSRSPEADLHSVELGSMHSGLVNPEWLAGLKAAALAEGNTILAGAVDQALAQTSSLTSTEIGSLGTGLSPDLLAMLKQAAVGVSLGAVGTQVATEVDALPEPVDEADLIEVGKTLSDEWDRKLEIEADPLPASASMTPPVNLAATDASPTTVKDVIATTVSETLAAQPQAVDESDLIEAGKNVAEAVLNPTGLTTAELGDLGSGLNNGTLATLKLAAAGAATVAAVQANLQSGVQPMIVDESDAIEAIKLAWDGDLSPAELAALEHTLILRPGETGRLGLVTCSVPSANCVSLGGLEGDLQTGDAMRSRLFNMAVTHNDDGNYVFSSLSKWMPDWSKSGDFSEHTDELTQLVWDNDPSAVEHAAGYQLTLREGQYGDLGLVSCAVNETGSVSLGGIVGSIAEGQIAVSKLYGIFVERAGDIYTFKQFSKPATTQSWGGSAQAALAAVGAGVAAKFSDTVDTVKEAVLPATHSTTTDTLEPDLTWSAEERRSNMQRLIAESHDRRGSKLVSQLWDSDSGYDCSVLEGDESLVLKPGLYGKLGSVHCGVTKPGRVVVSGDVSHLAEGEGVLFHLYNIVVCRDEEDNYRFERLNDLV
ncbi:MAG: hypothetical protein E6Q83_10115 [Thiothrix sp.]|nr:MAG: hypothetical protein E6Q83_10115 [Thiothrix sp.]